MIRLRTTLIPGVAALMLFGSRALGVVVFSYDASTGQFPTNQGWMAHEIDTTGPLTDPSPGGTVMGTSADNANAAIEMVNGMNVLHIRDTLTDSTADLPEFYYPWTSAEQLMLINNGLRFTIVLQGLTNATSNGNVRFGFNGTEFEFQNANIGADRTIQVTNFGGGLFPVDGAFHTLEITGQKNGANFDFAYTVDGGASTPLTIDANPAPAAFESTVYFGALSSGGRNSDLLVKSVVMETLIEGVSLQANVERTANSAYGSLTLRNNASPVTIAGYSILSNTGALYPGQWTSIADTYDVSGDGSVDNNDEWVKLTANASRSDLGEFEPDGDGAVIGAGQSISLGDVWIQNPTEDIVVDLLLADGSVLTLPIQYTGNGDNAFSFGDLDFDGDFDVDDFRNEFVPGFGADTAALSLAEKYQAGDFNQDDVVDEFDFLIYNAAYLDANPGAAALSFSSVPEPGAVTLLASGALVWAWRRRRWSGIPRLTCLSLLVAAVALIELPARSDAANPIAYWSFNEPSGATTLNDSVGANHSTSIGTALPGAMGQIAGAWTFDGANEAITIDASTGNLTGLGSNYSLSAWVKSTDNLGVIFSASDNTQGSEEVALRVSDNGAPDGRAGVLGRPNIDGPGGEALSTTYVNDDKWHHVAFTSHMNGWSIYVDGQLENSGASPTSPMAIGANVVHIGTNEDSGGVQWGLNGLLDDISIWDDPLTSVEVGDLYVKGLFGRGALEDFTDALSLDVNRTGSGAVTFKNTSPTPFEIDLYRIVSSGNSLQASGWNSLDEQDVDSSAWTELANGNGKVSEGAFGDSTVLANGFSQSLGNLYNTATDAQDLVLEYHVVGTPSTLLLRGQVNYVMSTAVAGDYNGNGVVDAADYVVWRNGGPLQNEGVTPNTTTPEDYDFWRSRFGVSSGVGSGITGAVADSVPEPGSMLLILLAGVLLAVRRWHAQAVSLVLAAFVSAAAFAPATAAVFVDRNYRLGDDASENGGNPAGLVGQPVGTLTGSITYDSAGTPGKGDLQDLAVNGNPTYVNVSNRPGASGNSLGVAFDGDGDALTTTINMNRPTDTWDNDMFFPSTPFPNNYEGIFAHGISLWAKPDQAALTAGQRQDVVIDTPENGVFIADNGTWGLQYDGGGDSGVSVASTLDANGWAHVMQIGGLADRTTGTSAFQGALYVNGVAVIATSPGQNHDTNSESLSVGSNPAADANFYKGVLDELQVFLWGDNTGQNSGDGRLGRDWGTFDLAADNDWIRQRLTALGVTSPADVNLNGTVAGNGTGPAASDDVTAFVEGWRSQRLVNGVQVGDWISRQNGDLNYDGIVDIRDASMLRLALVSAGTGSFDFRLLDRSVPEPTTLVLAAAGACCVFHWTRRRAGRAKRLRIRRRPCGPDF